MYFVSSILSIVSLLAFATFTNILSSHDLSPESTQGLRWASIGASCLLIFSVQVKARKHITSVMSLLSCDFMLRLVPGLFVNVEARHLPAFPHVTCLLPL